MVHLQWSSADYKWYSTPPLVSLSVLVNTPVLRDVLHWLPVLQRIQLKIAALTFDCVQGTGPAYFSSIVCTVAHNSGGPGLRSAEPGDLFVSRTRTTRLGRRSFFIAAPVVWNSLPLHLRSPSISRSQFRAGLKTHLLRLAFQWLFLWELLKRLNWTELVICRSTSLSDSSLYLNRQTVWMTHKATLGWLRSVLHTLTLDLSLGTVTLKPRPSRDTCDFLQLLPKNIL